MNRFIPLFYILALALFAVHASAQHVPVERDFERARKSLKLERFQQERDLFGDPGTRTFEYLYYHEKDKLVKIRLIEKEGKPDASIKVDDYFFVNGDLRLVRLYFFVGSSRHRLLRQGDIVPLLTGEHIEMLNGKLIRWTALGKDIPSTDRRWDDKQSSVLRSLQIELMYYNEFKKPNKEDKP